MASGNEGDARVDVLRNVSGDGFFYFNTHGGKGKTRQGREIFAMQSSSMATPRDRQPAGLQGRSRQRPARLHDGQERRLTSDGSTGAELVTKPAAAGSNSLLAPSIYALEPGPDAEDELKIHGSFGPDPGGAERMVTIAGQAMTVQEWTPERITVALPRSGSGSSGDVVVTVRGRMSNPRRLIAWRGKMTFMLRAAGSLTQKIDFDLHLRGDPDRARTRPGEAPEDLPDEFLLQAIPAQPANDPAQPKNVLPVHR